MGLNEAAPARAWVAADRRLKPSALVFAVAFVAHGVDHAIRGFTGDDRHAAWPGSLQIALGLVTLVIAGRGSRPSPG
jgi:hypothetical protein